MTQEDFVAQIAQLQAQQAFFTQIIAAGLQGKWTGEGSVEAFLYALDPTLQGTLDIDPPLSQSDVDTLPKG